MTLYHYTATERVEQIIRDGQLYPMRDFVSAESLARQADWVRENFGLIWMTDLDRPAAMALGLTNRIIRADRTEARFRVVGEGAIPWTKHRRHANPTLVDALESAPGAMPSHWYIATEPIAVVHDPIGVAV
ncbi:hypothetical protein [Prescottella equi]|uniref:Uncharacterized protein n=1 Tax=Rhodococcus hoagii TaxID=43767 RepID=A0AAE2W9A7_RHOHA|nr:hypothetical protein [Prescottella equi]MBM4716197.1 hypothetical protein [Prescottella equi]